jgi:acetyl-CoA acetyltransferase
MRATREPEVFKQCAERLNACARKWSKRLALNVDGSSKAEGHVLNMLGGAWIQEDPFTN